MKNNIQIMRPWDRVCTDAIGPWETSANETIKGKHSRNKKSRTKISTICAPTISDKSSSWLEIVRIGDKTSYETSRAFDKEWICRCPMPNIVLHGNGPEFKSEFLELLTLVSRVNLQQ